MWWSIGGGIIIFALGMFIFLKPGLIWKLTEEWKSYRTDDPVCISIDCDVKSEYEVSQLTGKADFENSLDNPDQVHDTTTMLTGAGRCFTFTAPGLSVNVLKLKKK